jgi:cysteinyl-tRNA synthetase
MNEDLNTAVALSVIFELVKLTNAQLNDERASSETLAALDESFTRQGGEVLGIVKERYESEAGSDEELVDNLVQAMIGQRQQARINKDFAAADGIRDKLAELGIILEDKPDGTTWRRK